MRPGANANQPSLSASPYRWITGLIAIIIVTALGIGGLTLHYLQSQAVATRGESLALLATDIADLLDRVLFERYGDAQMMADAFAGKMQDTSALTRYLNLMMERYLFYRWLGVTDAAGRIVAATDPASVGEDRSNAAWFQASRDGKGVFLQDVSVSTETHGDRAIGFSAPIRGPKGEFLGVVTARVGLSELEAVIRRTVSSFQSQHNNIPRVEWQFLTRDGTLIVDSPLREEGTVHLEQIGLSSARLSMATEPGYVEELHPRRQVPVITGYARTEGYGEFPGFHWGILVRMDRSDILHPIREVLKKLGAVGLLLFVPMLGLLLWMSKRLRREWTSAADQLMRLRGLHSVSKALQQEAPKPHTDFALAEFLQLLVDSAMQITGAKYGAFGLFDESGKHLVRFITGGMAPSTVQAIGAIPTGRGLLGFLAQEGDVLRLKDLTRHPTFTGFPPHHPPMRSFLGISVRVHGRVMGRFYLTEKQGADEFTDVDVEVISALAAQSGVAIENGYFLNQIRAAERHYRTTMAALPVAVVRLDHENIVRFANQMFYKFIQRNETDTLGQPIDVLLPREELTTLLHAIRAQGAPSFQEQDCQYLAPDMPHCRLIARAIHETDEIVLVIKDISAQKQVEQERTKLMRDRLLLLESTGEGIFGIDLQTRCTFINRAGAAMLGYRPEELLGRNMHELIHHTKPDGARYPAEDCPIARSCLSGQGCRLDDEVLWRRDGTSFHAEYAVRPILDEDWITGAVVTFANITERKRAELALAEKTQELSDFIEHASVSMHWVGPDGIILWANQAELDLLGYTREEYIGRPIADFHVDQPVIQGILDRLSHAKAVQEYAARLRCKDGSIKDVLIDSSVLWQDGEFIHTRCFTRDITERRRAEEALRMSQARMQAILENALDAVIGIDEDGRITDWNPRAETIFGWASGEAIGRDLAETIIPLQYREAHRHGLRHFLVTGEGPFLNRRIELTALRRDGNEFPVEISILPLKLGKQYWFSAFVADITERKRAEEALQASEAQLRQSQKMEAVGQLAGGIAHDFNNILMVINGYSALLLRELGPDSPLHRYPREIAKAGDRAAALTQQLLAFSRRQVITPSALHLNEAVTSMQDMLRRLIGEHIELVLALAPHLDCVMADRSQIEQVIMNLVVNARDAMPNGGRLTIETANVALDEAMADSLSGVAPGPHVTLAVRDTGHGMDAATQARIFEPFFTTKEPGMGTGLGLASVFGIVKQSGGAIVVQSEPGQGTVFHIYLPRAAGDAVEPQPAATAAQPTGGRETILLVEDQEEVRAFVQEILQEAGYQVLVAHDGIEALALSERYKEPIHLLLTDVVMPKMSGRQVADRLALLCPAMKVLYLSGYTDDALGAHGVLDPGTPLLFKPFEADVLLRTLRELLDAGPR
ncbi:MAG: PAS domain S-box protein [Nitrospirae bacterium]|nr:MAG: PAS domain S-box protein [Nitrospirota bacterium]